MKESVKIISSKNKVIIRIFREQDAPGTDFAYNAQFELRSLCDIPILIFKLSPSGEVFAVPVNFRKTGNWPDFQKLPLHLQLFDMHEERIVFEKEIVLGKEDTESIFENRTEQTKMKSRQIDAIVDFIYSDYIGFAQLAESF